MKNKTFCTIITADHLAFAKTLYKSLRQHDNNCKLHILVIDAKKSSPDGEIIYLQLNDIKENIFFKEIERKYAHTNADLFRWALKPILIGHLLKQEYKKVIFLDPDLFFVGKFNFLWDLLDTNSILLTPHWADLDVNRSEDSILSILRNGLFNAGLLVQTKMVYQL